MASSSFDDAGFDEDNHDVAENLFLDQPSPLELQIQTSRIYAEIAANEHRLGDLEQARDAQQTSERAYREANQLLTAADGTGTRVRLEEIRLAIEQNRRELGLS